MARKKSDDSTVKTAAKGAGAFYAIKKLFKGAFIVAGIAAVTKIVRGKSATT
jgi:hypothetical protein